jgi:hypothetical protein
MSVCDRWRRVARSNGMTQICCNGAMTMTAPGNDTVIAPAGG